MARRPSNSLPISAGPNQRAGLNPPPVSGPKIMMSRPSVQPIASGAHSLRARGLNATAQTASTSRKVPIPSMQAPATSPDKSGLIDSAP